MEVCVRRKQRNRAGCHVGTRLDRDDLSHREGFSLACALHRGHTGDAEPRDVEGRAVVAVGIEATMGAPEPAPPLDWTSPVLLARRAVGAGRLSAPGAGMRGAVRGFGAKADAQQVAFVTQDAPDLGAHRRIVPAVAPLAAYATAWPSRFERREALPTDE